MKYIFLLLSFVSLNVFANTCGINGVCAGDNMIVEFTNTAKVEHLSCHIWSYAAPTQFTASIKPNQNVQFEPFVLWHIVNNQPVVEFDMIQNEPGTPSSFRISKIYGDAVAMAQCQLKQN